jgi:hypothetical protein
MGEIHYGGFGMTCGGSPPACGRFYLDYEGTDDWTNVTCKNCLKVKKELDGENHLGFHRRIRKNRKKKSKVSPPCTCTAQQESLDPAICEKCKNPALNHPAVSIE